MSDQETINLGRKLGSVLEEGDVIAMAGELGSGKTWFAKGVGSGLGVPEESVITSPSFALVNEYKGRCPFLHMDIYRLEEVSDFLSAGLDEYFYGNGVVVVEWADRWPSILPEWRLEVKFEIVDDQTRAITFSRDHPRAMEILKNFESQSS
ncbi:MAG: tRNA (adenosine(37)-N6)-threonylcarbamoyltransferase complex ATPase subunit type 1 TsaE [Desulfobacteraceae bacterium]|nr:tRNA (adenosine(37)-N6)-threonylcarbamoyltransferase complex ATPase subunit type 1 TsaE [Desulfobacteraceae bacterium]